MQIQPTTNYILLRVIEHIPEGIILPEDHTPMQPHGQVLACGPLVKEITPGDLVLFMPQLTLIEVSNDGEKTFLVSESGIIGKYIQKEVRLN